jgi:AraC family transcriptional regulator of adaptative response/methylated-DNA-[protein]-cysteine methyltransferase
MTPRGICALDFVLGADEDAVSLVRARWPAAEVRLDPVRTRAVAQALAGQTDAPLWPLHVQGTNFQITVWRALLNTRAGQLTSYARLAAQTGRAGAARAVGQAVGANPVAVLIPCHRVIRETGVLGGYRWGLPRKQALLLRELGPVATPD